MNQATVPETKQLTDVRRNAARYVPILRRRRRRLRDLAVVCGRNGVILPGDNKPTTIKEVLRSQDVIQEGQLDLPDAQAAQDYQESVLRTDTGPYNYYSNSCVTHLVNVLNAGGLNLPTSTRAAIAALKRISGG